MTNTIDTQLENVSKISTKIKNILGLKKQKMLETPTDNIVTLEIIPKYYDESQTYDLGEIILKKIEIPEFCYVTTDINKAGRPYPNYNVVVFGKDDQMGVLCDIDRNLLNKLNSFTINFTFEYELKDKKVVSVNSFRFDYEEIYKKYNILICSMQHCTLGSAPLNHFYWKGNIHAYGSNITKDDCAKRNIFSQHDPLHSRKQETKLTKYNKIHNSNAIIDLPISLFLDALLEAEMEPSKESFNDNHRAIKILTEAWNNHEKVPHELKCAGSVDILIRANEENIYYPIDEQAPEREITNIRPKCKQCAATIGDHILVIFLQRAMYENDEYKQEYNNLVDGDFYSDTGGRFDESSSGYYQVEGLLEFSSNYNKIHNHMIEKDGGTICFEF